MEKLLVMKNTLPAWEELKAKTSSLIQKGCLAAAVFGDSILRGVMFDEAAGSYRIYRDRFADSLNRFHAVLTNNSRFGFTVERGTSLIHDTVTAEAHPEFVFLEYGSNDCNYNWAEVDAAPDGEHFPVTAPDAFRKQYEELVDYVTACGSVPVVVLPPPIDSEKFLGWICRKGLSRERILHWLGSADAIYRWQEYYTGLCEKIARERGCPILDLRTPFLISRQYDGLLCADGMHPTERGHRLIDEAFCRFFERLED